jgi:DNA topoisomerase 2-associated protein PAT1
MPVLTQCPRRSIYDHLFNILAPYLVALFPSPGALVLSLSSPDLPPDALEEPVWQFLAMLALHATNEQQQILVTTLRERILENVVSVNKGLVADDAVRQMKIANVNIFLHALGLDSSQIAM